MSEVQQVKSALKRSQKTDFGISRERSFVKSNGRDGQQHQKRKSQTFVALNKGKPTMEIYRPPNVRSDLPQGKLNVHAKEFTMNDIQPSRSGGNLAVSFEPLPLQHSRSSGNILRHHTGLISVLPAPMTLPIFPRTNFTAMDLLAHHHQHQQQQQHPQPIFTGQNHSGGGGASFLSFGGNREGLKRSKSMSAADSRHLIDNLKGLTKIEPDLGTFPNEDQENLKLAVEDPNLLPSRTLMDLVNVILQRVLEGIRYCEAGAKVCISIIEKERNHTFLESLVNTCQQWYQERDRVLRGVRVGDSTRFTAFMWFLTEMCGLLKRSQFKNLQIDRQLQPDLVLLSLLAKCCQACVSPPIRCLPETECLFFVLSSIGRDLENEVPAQLEQLMASVRDGFLESAGTPAVRRTLLQLIELHASSWQLPASSVLYYYPRVK